MSSSPLPADTGRLAEALEGRRRRRSPRLAHPALAASLMDTTRARDELGWRPARDAGETLLEHVHAMRRGDGRRTPRSRPAALALRIRELPSGVGRPAE